MMIESKILYIGYRHCTSVAQLIDYFSEDFTPDSDIYADLLDYGRHGDIATWLREMDETALAANVDAINTNLSDSAFYARLKSALTGSDVKQGPKPLFDKCFSFEGVKCDAKDNETKVIVSLKVLMCVNETYELSVSSNWGTRAECVNPYNHPEGKTASFEFTLRKRPGKDVGEITVKADGKVLSQSNGNSDEILVGEVKFKMIHVEGGTFTMGATPEQKNPFNEEKPTHQVMLCDYNIGETPVTQELWQAVMGSNPSNFKGAQRPVENVNWYDCQEFIRKLNQKTGKEFRLPTEAEWEFAARGGLKSKGYQYSGGNNIDEVAWYYRNSSDETHLVKTKKPNELGIYDMSGNVWELCVKGRYSNNSRYSNNNSSGFFSSLINLGVVSRKRGGGWHSSENCCCPLYQSQESPSYCSSFLGFRLALSK